MKAGRLKEKLKVYSPFIEKDKFGSEKTSYNLVKTIYAERVKISSRRSEEVGEHFSDYSVRFYVRSLHTLKENWRVEEVGGYTYIIVAIEPNKSRGLLTLICERLNP